VSDGETLDRSQQVQRHAGDFACVRVFVSDRQAADHHVGVANRLHFVHVVVFNYRVKTRVQIVQKIDNLKIWKKLAYNIPITSFLMGN